MLFHSIGVTLSDLGMTSTNLKQLIKAGVTKKNIENLATSISLTDLEVVFDLLPNTAEKLHYLQRRRELESNIEYIGDELDLLAWYLDDGFNLGKNQEKYGLFKMDLKSKQLDHYIIGTANNEKVTKPSLRRSPWWIDILNRLESKKPEHWITISYLLHNFNYEDQIILSKMKDQLTNAILTGKTEKRHNWILLTNAETKRQFTIAIYCYTDNLKNERDDMMSDILYSKEMEGMKGALVIAINVNQKHYPYSSLAFRMSPELFENKYMRRNKKSWNLIAKNFCKNFTTFFQNIEKPMPGNAFEMGLFRFLQKCVSDPWKELHFCSQYFHQLLSEISTIFQTKKQNNKRITYYLSIHKNTIFKINQKHLFCWKTFSGELTIQLFKRFDPIWIL